MHSIIYQLAGVVRKPFRTGCFEVFIELWISNYERIFPWEDDEGVIELPSEMSEEELLHTLSRLEDASR